MKRDQRTAIYPGTFDPFTRGHLDILERALPLFDRLVVAVLVNPEKTPLLGEEERTDLIAAEVGRRRGVEVRAFHGLGTRLARELGAPPRGGGVRASRGLGPRLAEELGAGWIVRGVRSADDLAGELPMALSN